MTSRYPLRSSAALLCLLTAFGCSSDQPNQGGVAAVEEVETLTEDVANRLGQLTDRLIRVIDDQRFCPAVESVIGKIHTGLTLDLPDDEGQDRLEVLRQHDVGRFNVWAVLLDYRLLLHAGGSSSIHRHARSTATVELRAERAVGLVQPTTSSNPTPLGRSSWSIVHSAASLSVRHRRNRVAWRNLPPCSWS